MHEVTRILVAIDQRNSRRSYLSLFTALRVRLIPCLSRMEWANDSSFFLPSVLCSLADVMGYVLLAWMWTRSSMFVLMDEMAT